MSEFRTPPEIFETSIDSVLSQSFSDFELIIVDDSGNHRVNQLLQGISDSRIVVIENQINLGLSKSLNCALSRARGEYLARMDTDDVYDVNHLETLVGYIIRNQEFAAISSLSREISDDDKIEIFGRPGPVDRNSLIRGRGLNHPGSLITKSSILEVGGYPTDFQRAEDFALWSEMAVAGYKMTVLKDVTFTYRVYVEDYRKRKLSNRVGQVKAYLHYFPIFGAKPRNYLIILRTIFGGILPPKMVRWIRRKENASRRYFRER